MTVGSRIKIDVPVTQVKNKQQLMDEVQTFAGVLWKVLESSDDNHSVMLTFKREHAHEFAMTLYQLLNVLKKHKDN
jgi:hypothetical protein